MAGVAAGIICSIFLFAGDVAAAEEPPLLHLGANKRDRLDASAAPLPGHGPVCRYSFIPRSSGLVSASLESCDFDAYLRVVDAEGKAIRDDNDSGVETNAWLIFRALEGRRYTFEVASAHEGGGEFVLAIVADSIPMPTGADLIEASIDFRRRAANRALRRGDEVLATEHSLALGELLSAHARYEDAIAVLEQAVDFAREIKDVRAEVRGLEGLGYCHLGQRDSTVGLQCFQELIVQARANKLSEEELRGQRLRGETAWSLGQESEWQDALERQLVLARELKRREEEAEALGELREHWEVEGDATRLEALWRAHLEFCEEVKDPLAAARARIELGALCLARGAAAQAWEFSSAARKQLLAVQDPQASARANALHGRSALALGKTDEVRLIREALHDALIRARAEHDANAALAALSAIADVAVTERSADAAQRVREMQEAAQSEVDEEAHAGALELYGLLAVAEGRIDEGRDYFRRAHKLARANRLQVAAARLGRRLKAAGGDVPDDSDETESR